MFLIMNKKDKFVYNFWVYFIAQKYYNIDTTKGNNPDTERIKEMTEYRIENHYYRWTVIDKLTNILKDTYALLESSIGDEAPLILVKWDESKFQNKEFTNKRTGEKTTLPVIPESLIIDDEVYDDILIALDDKDIPNKEF